MTYTAFLSLCGSFCETKEEYGISHILEHMLFKGTQKRDMFQISEDAALMGAVQNAYTSHFEVSYHLTAPNDYTEKQVELLSDMMFNSTFPAEEWEKERGVIQEERLMYANDHGSHFHKEIGHKLIGGQWSHDVIGYEDTIDNITQEQIANFHKTKYGKDNTMFLIVTPVPFRKVVKYCKKYFGELPDNAAVPEPDKEVMTGARDITIKRAGIDQSWLVGLYDNGWVTDDLRQRAIGGIITAAIGGGMNSMLFREVREKGGLCYSVGAGNYSKYANKQLGYVYTQLSPENVDKAKEKIDSVFDDAASNGLTDVQFQAVQAQMLTSMYSASGNVGAIASAVQGRLLRNLEYSPKKTQKILNSITLDEINANIREYVDGIDLHWAEMQPE
jgi:predicted Zn-dependent peptidase